MAVRKARAIGVLRVPPRHRRVRVLLGCERRERGPRVPDVPPRKGHARTCGPPEVRPAAPSRRATARGGVAARRHQRRVLHAARARERAGSLRERPRGRQSGAPARRSQTHPPARSRPHRERHTAPASELRTAACPPERAADRRRNDRNSRLRAERSVRHLYANDLANALFSDVLRDPVRPPHLARFAFLDPRSRALWVDWEKAAWDTVASLRAEAGRNPYDRALSDLIGQLSTRSEEFRERWATHDVKLHRTGTNQFH